jgi:sulfur-oxidizing protein SoxY
MALLAFGRRAARGALAEEIAAAPPPVRTLEERLLPILAGRQPKPGRVSLHLPEFAEDGRVVPVGIAVDSPMTESDHVKAVHLLVDKNPDPLILTVLASPSLGRAEWRFKIRVAESSAVRAIAEMSDGALYTSEVTVAVNLGGCE